MRCRKVIFKHERGYLSATSGVSAAFRNRDGVTRRSSHKERGWIVVDVFMFLQYNACMLDDGQREMRSCTKYWRCHFAVRVSVRQVF